MIILEEIVFSKLTNENYCYLQSQIEIINPDINTSALYLNFLKYYGFTVYFKVNEDSIYFFYKTNDNLEKYIEKNEDSKIALKNLKKISYVFLRPIAKNESIVIDNIKHLIHWSNQFANDSNIYFDYLRYEDLNLLIGYNYSIIWNIDLSYLYENEQLKYFAGKKMQKKRNYLNFFNNNYLSDSKIIKYNSLYKNKILQFCYNHILFNSNQSGFRYSEFEAIKNLLEIYDNDKNLSGSILFYKDEIIGVTIGYSHLNYYEIFLEKASKDIKGSYQYLLSQNLILNNIENIYIDRQDSESEINLVMSKKSYKPFKIINTNLVRINYELKN